MYVWISSNNSRPSVSRRASIFHYSECCPSSTKQYYAVDQSILDLCPSQINTKWKEFGFCSHQVFFVVTTLDIYFSFSSWKLFTFLCCIYWMVRWETKWANDINWPRDIKYYTYWTHWETISCGKIEHVQHSLFVGIIKIIIFIS